MSTNRIFTSFLLGWPIVVAASLAGRATVAAASLSWSEYAGWIFLAAAPVSMVLLIAGNRSSRSTAEVIYDVEHSGETTEPTPRIIRG